MASELMNKMLDQSQDLEPSTPYSVAKQEWDNRIGNAVIQAYNWRRISFVMSGAIIILLVGLIIVSRQPKYIPYVVEVGDKSVTNIAKINNAKYIPHERQIKHYLIKFVEKIRTISSDKEVNKKWLFEAYSFLTPKTANKLDQYFINKDNDIMYKLKEQQTVSVAINSFTAVSSNLYQIQWTEETHDLAGKLISKEQLVGFATIKIVSPVSEASILQNPLGIWITDFSWSKAMSDE